MKKIIFLLLFVVSINVRLFADVETYVTPNSDGTVNITYYYPGSDDSLEHVLRETGLWPKPTYKTDPRLFPPMSDRQYWIWKNGSVEIDQVKKSQDEAQKQADINRYQALCQKMGLTKDECKEFKKLQKEVADDA